MKLLAGWKWVRLEELCDKISLNNLKIKQKDYLAEGKYPVVDQGQDLIGGYYNDENLVIPNEPPYIVFGDHTKVKKFINFKFIAGADGVKVLKPKEIIDPWFLFYSLFIIKIEDKGYARHFQLLEKELFPLPEISEQHAIVAKIEELLSELDKGKQQLETAQQQLKVYRQALLKWAFEGKLTNKEVKDGELPEGWIWVKLEEVSQSCLGKMLDKKKNTGTLKPYLRNINVRWNNFDLEDLFEMRFEESESDRFGILKGDLIICEGGEPGRAAIWNEQFPNIKIQKALHRVRFKGKATAEFFLFYLNLISSTKALDQYFTGTTIKHLTGQSLRKISFPFPSIDEQQQVVHELESRLSVCDKVEETITISLKQAETLRQSILKKAFEGKLV